LQMDQNLPTGGGGVTGRQKGKRKSYANVLQKEGRFAGQGNGCFLLKIGKQRNIAGGKRIGPQEKEVYLPRRKKAYRNSYEET